MKTITLEMCIKGLTREGKVKMLMGVISAFLTTTMFMFRYGITTFSVIVTVLMFLALLALCLWQRRKDKKIKAENIYLVDDVFLRVEITRTWQRWVGRQELCVVDFAHHGSYEVAMYEETKEPENPTCDYSAVHLSNPGDDFYLLMLRDEEGDRILKCFHKRFYALSEEDFVLTDGEYRPKTAKG